MRLETLTALKLGEVREKRAQSYKIGAAWLMRKWTRADIVWKLRPERDVKAGGGRIVPNGTCRKDIKAALSS